MLDRGAPDTDRACENVASSPFETARVPDIAVSFVTMNGGVRLQRYSSV